MPSKVFCALTEHTGEGFYGDKTAAAVSALIQQWIATTPAARCPWREEQDENDESNDSTASQASAAPPQTVPAPTAAPGPASGAAGSGPETSRGYQWKQLFLPNGTELRTIYGGRSIYAKVEDEQIISVNGPTTPSRLANTQGCGTRNAWRAIWLRLPGSARWQRAADCRRQD
ncbi:hypothetical protein GJ698_15420 [Pseudoduganella sp. FT26W]|uniref:Uncharacterized protein n=1 Tax=Duganella aquatilis TaxID=2666082 RepID=A0A844D9N7_9BURK|nr:hypothetical protein [Duganella aquatilis]